MESGGGESQRQRLLVSASHGNLSPLCQRPHKVQESHHRGRHRRHGHWPPRGGTISGAGNETSCADAPCRGARAIARSARGSRPVSGQSLVTISSGLWCLTGAVIPYAGWAPRRGDRAWPALAEPPRDGADDLGRRAAADGGRRLRRPALPRRLMRAGTYLPTPVPERPRRLAAAYAGKRSRQARPAAVPATGLYSHPIQPA